MNTALKQAKHFTLAEMMTVILIIAILATIGFAVITRVQGDAMRTATLAQINNLYVAVESFKMDQGYYPGSHDFNTNDYYIGIDRLDSSGNPTNIASDNYILNPTSKLREYFTFGENDTEKHKFSGSSTTRVFLVDAWGTPLRYMFYSDYESRFGSSSEPQDDVKNKSKFLSGDIPLIYSVGQDGEEETSGGNQGCCYDFDTTTDDDPSDDVDDVFVSDI